MPTPNDPGRTANASVSTDVTHADTDVVVVKSRQMHADTDAVVVKSRQQHLEERHAIKHLAYNRNLIVSLSKEPSRARVKDAQGRGVKFGRKRKLSEAQIAHAREQIEKGKKGRQEIGALFKVDRATLYRALAA